MYVSTHTSKQSNINNNTLVYLLVPPLFFPPQPQPALCKCMPLFAIKKHLYLFTFLNSWMRRN